MNAFHNKSLFTPWSPLLNWCWPKDFYYNEDQLKTNISSCLSVLTWHKLHDINLNCSQ